MRMTRTSRRVVGLRWSFLLIVVLSLSPLVQIARADGGIVIFQRSSPPFIITLFSTEMPLRQGPADLSVLLEKTEGHSPILDAQVFIELEHEGGTIIRAEATRNQARNKLLYCSLIEVPLSGRWKMIVCVIHGNYAAEVVNDLVLAAPQPLLFSYWKLTAAPAVIIILFILNQWLGRSPLIPQKAGARNP
jgi:hypothetical protein